MQKNPLSLICGLLGLTILFLMTVMDMHHSNPNLVTALTVILLVLLLVNVGLARKKSQ